MAGPHGRRVVGAVGHRPAPVRGLRTRPRRRVLPPPPKAWPQRRRAASGGPSTTPLLTDLRHCRHHPDANVAKTPTRSHVTGAEVVPSNWRATTAEPVRADLPSD